MSDLRHLVSGIPGFTSWNHAKLLRFFAWFQHSVRKRERFQATDLRACYLELNLDAPSSISPFLSQMEKRRPREVIRDARGYYLEARVRDEFEPKYGQRRESAVQVDKLLRELPNNLPNLVERAYLDEALICFRSGAFRAAIVMCWNLAYDHLCEFVLSKHLTDFNAQLPKSFPKADIAAVGKKDDFQELKEYQVLQVCRSASIISPSLHKILKEKLDRRNVAAHPSNVIVLQYQAEDFITDLINNVVLKLV